MCGCVIGRCCCFRDCEYVVVIVIMIVVVARRGVGGVLRWNRLIDGKTRRKV